MEELTPRTERHTRPLKWTCTNVILVLNILGFAVSGLLPGLFGIDLGFLTFDAWLAIGKIHLWQFLTYSFIHPIGGFYPLFAIFLAYFILFQMGNELEAEIGPRRYALFYSSFAFYGALAHAIYQYVGNTHAPALTFVGPVQGIFMACALRNPGRPIMFFFVIPMRMITCALLLGAITVFYCLVYLKAGISPFSVLGAMLSAWAILRLEPKLDTFLARSSVHRAQARVLEEHEVRREVDRILQKISQTGMDSLTRAEKKMLKKGSSLASRSRGSGRA